MLDSPESVIWSVFRLQPTETEQAGAGEEGRTLSTCKNNIHKSHFWPSDPSWLGPLPPVKVSDGTQRKDTGSYVVNVVIQTNQIIFWQGICKS